MGRQITVLFLLSVSDHWMGRGSVGERYSAAGKDQVHSPAEQRISFVYFAVYQV